MGEDRVELHRTRISSKLRGELQEEENDLRQLLEKMMHAHPELGV
jgi:hypothetical protein